MDWIYSVDPLPKKKKKRKMKKPKLFHFAVLKHAFSFLFLF